MRGYSEATRTHYGQSLNVLFQFLASQAVDDVREVTGAILRDYRAFLLAHYRTWSVHAHLQAARRFFEHLERSDAILLNPCAGIVLPRLGKRLPRVVLTPGEARRMLEEPDTQTRRGIRDRAILEVFYSTGIRLEEMTGLTIHDVDTRQGFLRINRGKFAKDRIVPLGRKACDYVREYLQKVRSEWSRADREQRALWLSFKRPHQPLKKQAIEVMVRDYARRAGLGKRVTPHVWRHTCATHLAANGSDLVHVQRLLGHRSLRTTQIYTRVSIPDVRRTLRHAHPRYRGRP